MLKQKTSSCSKQKIKMKKNMKNKLTQEQTHGSSFHLLSFLKLRAHNGGKKERQ